MSKLSDKIPLLSSSDGVAKFGGGGQMSNNPPVLKAPFPYPGGKSKIADTVWNRFGDVDNYIEPFCGTMAVLLRRPKEHFAKGYRVETVNDANGYIVNFWRAVQRAPEKVAYYADQPIFEADLHARHRWLVRSDESHRWRHQFSRDPDYFDAKIAGWWVWGQCCWIGGAWCTEGTASITPETNDPSMMESRPQLTDAFDIGRGVNQSANISNACEHERRPGFNNGGLGWGVNASASPDSSSLSRGVCGQRKEWLVDWMQRLADRIRLVRTCYGHWSRICDSDSTLTRLGVTGVFLDPPYPSKKADGTRSRDDSLYTTDKTQDLDALRDEVLAWCRKWGDDPKIRVAVCGYEGDGYEALGWDETSWKTAGGYANQRRGGKAKNENAKRERIWWSPASVKEKDLFSMESA